MTAKVYIFPEIQKNFGFKIPLYTETEIEISVLCVNAFSCLPNKINEKNLGELDPKFVIESLQKAKQCQYITFHTKKIIDKILNNVEKISL